jgi:hypothetical protein
LHHAYIQARAVYGTAAVSRRLPFSEWVCSTRAVSGWVLISSAECEKCYTARTPYFALGQAAAPVLRLCYPYFCLYCELKIKHWLGQLNAALLLNAASNWQRSALSAKLATHRH